MGAGTAIAGFFGMNLVSGLEEHPNAFFWATGSGIGLMAGAFLSLSEWIAGEEVRSADSLALFLRQTVIMSIGWYRLVRARRSQLFLRSALKQRKKEDINQDWGVGPVNLASKGKQSRIEGGKQGGGEKKEKKSEAAEDRLMKKDGTEL